MQPVHSAIGFRTDINGLRAWAVIAVVLFHFRIPGFSGGFSGVDVFFVISGFLMTSIIVGGLRKQDTKFSIIGFYLARARRIIPALAGVCATLLILGWFFLAPQDYSKLSKHIISSLGFFSNFTYWLEAGYFDNDSHEKWLLHTWSLSVEWQFYLILPLILLILWKISKSDKFLKIATFAGIVLSLGLSIWLTNNHPEAAFYLLPTRAWEMLAGGLVFLAYPNGLTSNRLRVIANISGLSLITFSSVCFSNTTPWPGIYAAFPVMGAVLILLAAKNDSVFTKNSLSQWLGTRSYSIYLWHWPLVVMTYYLGYQDNYRFICICLALTFLLSDVSYRIAEKPAQRWLGKIGLKTNISFFSILLIFITIPCLVLKHYQGAPQRLPSNVLAVDQERLNINPRKKECLSYGMEFKSCVYGGSNISAIVLGDSHANSLVTAIEASLPNKTDGVLFIAYAACPTIYGAKKINMPNVHCEPFNSWAKKQISEAPAHIPVIIINRTTAQLLGRLEDGKESYGKPLIYFSTTEVTANPEFIDEFQKRLIKTACSYATERTVFMLRPIPEPGVNVPAAMSRAMILGKNANIEIKTNEYHERNKYVWDAQDAAAQQCGVKILDPIPLLCTNKICKFSHNGRPIYSDDDHISEYGNRLLIPLFQSIF